MSIEESNSSHSDMAHDGDAPDSPALDYPVEPLSAAMLGKLFGIPLLIITVIVGGAVTVVLLFGAPTAPKAHSLEDLLHALSVSGGQRNAGMLLPREKEHWQAGLELSERLKKGEFSPEQLETAAQRLIVMLEQETAASAQSEALTGTPTTNPQTANALRIQFLIRALGRTNRPQVLPILILVLDDPWANYNDLERNGFLIYTVQELANLHSIDGARAAISPLVALMEKKEDAAIRLASCTALSVLAMPSDHMVIEALSSVRLSSEGEVGWSASLALARLGSLDGKPTLLDLLDRSFWESGERYHTTDNSGVTRSYVMPASLIQQWLMAAIDASSNLDDADLWKMINRLQSDASPAVKQRAKAAFAARSN